MCTASSRRSRSGSPAGFAKPAGSRRRRRSPTCVAPGCPCPRRSHRTHQPGHVKRIEAVGGSQTASTPFHTGYERDRGTQPAATKGGQDEGPLPQRGRRTEADLPRDPKRRAAIDQDPGVDKGTARVQDSLRTPTTQLNHQPRLIAVGTAIAGRPPRRSQRARLTHWAPALGSGVEACGWPGMVDLDLG
jgi:hypothetical protein